MCYVWVTLCGPCALRFSLFARCEPYHSIVWSFAFYTVLPQTSRCCPTALVWRIAGLPCGCACSSVPLMGDRLCIRFVVPPVTSSSAPESAEGEHDDVASVVSNPPVVDKTLARLPSFIHGSSPESRPLSNPPLPRNGFASLFSLSTPPESHCPPFRLSHGFSGFVFCSIRLGGKVAGLCCVWATLRGPCTLRFSLFARCEPYHSIVWSFALYTVLPQTSRCCPAALVWRIAGLPCGCTCSSVPLMGDRQCIRFAVPPVTALSARELAEGEDDNVASMVSNPQLWIKLWLICPLLSMALLPSLVHCPLLRSLHGMVLHLRSRCRLRLSHIVRLSVSLPRLLRLCILLRQACGG